MNIKSSEELKPCPFCGGEATVGLGSMGLAMDPIGQDGYYIECLKCATMSDMHFDIKEAAAEWNRRVETPNIKRSFSVNL